MYFKCKNELMNYELKEIAPQKSKVKKNDTF